MLKDAQRKLGRRVREVRLLREMTQEQLAEAAGITWHFVSGIERGVRGATLETLLAICAALDVSLSELFLEVDRPVPREMERLATTLAGLPVADQRAVLRVLEDALKLLRR